MVQMLSKDQVSLFVKNKAQFYEACQTNGFYLPPSRNQFITQKFLLEVYNGTCYCPKQVDVKPLFCLNPPPNHLLVEMIATMIEQNDSYANEEQANQYKRLATHMRRHTPDKQWMLGLLSNLNPGHEVFQKGYLPPPVVVPQQQAPTETVANHGGFFDGLAQLSDTP